MEELQKLKAKEERNNEEEAFTAKDLTPFGGLLETPPDKEKLKSLKTYLFKLNKTLPEVDALYKDLENGNMNSYHALMDKIEHLLKDQQHREFLKAHPRKENVEMPTPLTIGKIDMSKHEVMKPIVIPDAALVSKKAK